MKTLGSIVVVLILFMSLGCKTVTNDKILNTMYKNVYSAENNTEKIEGSDKLVNTNYKLNVKKSPDLRNPNIEIKIDGVAEYTYETRIYKTDTYQKKGIFKYMTFTGAAGMLGGVWARNTNRSGGAFLVGTGAILFITGLITPDKVYKQVVVPGPRRWRELDVIPSSGSPVTIKNGTQSKIFNTDYQGIVKFNPATDFKLSYFKNNELQSFSAYLGEQLIKVNGWDTYFSFHIANWNPLWVTVIDTNAIITDSYPRKIAKPLFFSTYKTTGSLNKGMYPIEMKSENGTTYGYISENYVDAFYSYNDVKNKSTKESISRYVETKIESWQKKDEFESTQQYKDRLATRGNKINELTNEALRIWENAYIESIDWNTSKIGSYDADRETFKITITRIGDIFLKVPRDSARNFRDKFDYYDIVKPRFSFNPEKDSWDLTSLAFENYDDSVSYPYTYDPGLGANYNPLSGIISGINIEDVKIVFDANENRQTTVTETVDDEYNIEYAFPETNMKDRGNAFAVIIGNTNYKDAPKVNYAINDARLMKEYLIQVMGFKSGNIIYKEDASKTDFDRIFGTADKLGSLNNMVPPNGMADIFIYFVGHGAPGVNSNDKNEAYFVPIDGSGGDLEITGYPAKTFYSNLNKIPAAKKTVVIDACFSGDGVHKGVSSLGVKPKEFEGIDDKTIVIASSQGDQFSTWFDVKKHGMFTYFFLKAIHDKSKSDKDKNGKLTYQELYDYISDPSEGVPYWVRRVNNGRQQNPTIKGKNTDKVFIEYK